ncbi:MAG: WG repeat-containing protein, partial [Bacteroidales bacterium]|nr:WG repeat-containing protein [Bacteroidales bacterium]
MKKNLRNFSISIMLCSIFTFCSNYENVKLYPVSNESGEYGFIDESGNLIIQYKFEYAHRFYNNRALVLSNGKAFYINKKGNILFEASIKAHNEIKSNDSSDIIIDNTYSKVYFNNIPKYYFFNENLAAYYDTSRHAFGFIDTKGNLVISPKFAIVNSFSE